MAFSVLLSLYHKENPEFLRQSLDSVFSQTLRPDEVILVEDGPLTAELYAVLDEYEKNHTELRRVKLPENGGLGKALNEGVKYCSYNLVARMDTDDIAKHDRFERQIEIFDKYPDADIVSSWIEEFIDTPENIVSTRKLPEFQYEIYRYGKTRCPVNHPAVMFKKDAVLFAGGYRHFPLFEDYYLWVRLLLNGAKFYNVQDSLLYFRTSKEMYRRRGGFGHALNEIKFQNHIRKIGYTTYPQFLFNVAVRFVTRIVPNKLRSYIYRTFLRR
ncbi:MAG: glycosyltransferase [Muribaculaceae bacterium]|nr:glycosyltransferase [Muribaculaceae bacterium]